MRLLAFGSILLLTFIQQCLCSDVLDLTEDFDSSIGLHETVLVKFYAPWCGHCKRLAPEYEEAAKKLKSHDPPIVLAKVDCTSDKGKDVCSVHGVNGYPTLKIFKDGEFSSEYNGPRQSDGIVKYMKSKVGPASKLFSDKSQLQAALDKASDVVVLGVFEKDGASDMQSSFLKVADKLRESVTFYHVFQSDVPDLYSIDRLSNLKENVQLNSNNVLVVRPKTLANKFEPSIVDYSGSGDLSEFIKKNYHGLVGVRTQDNMNDFKMPLISVYYDVDYVKNPKGTNYWRNRVLKVAQNHKDLNFAVSSSNQFAMELDDFGFERQKDRDSAPSVTARDEQGLKYKMEEKFSIENLEKFVKDLKSGSLEPFIKSEPVPSDNENVAVKTAVGKNIHDLVLKSDKDVLIEFYAPWCGHCKNLAPTYEELGQAMKDEPNVMIVKMDATANDVPPEFSVQGFPTIYWYPKSKQARKYEGGRDLENFIEYISKHSTEELVGYDRKGNKKSKEEL
ncbi:Protein disulfide-isomerase A3 [Sarcoptes scabiei]|nr:Protein disulfide-isomerase A3 [Sarcoptes scabiei]UXI14366.1 Protein disulfide-isomerase A3 [Sarcoptes scabiei]